MVDRVKELAAEGNMYQLKVVSEDGDVPFGAPLTIGLAVSGVDILTAPWLAVLGVIADFVKRVKIEFERIEDHPEE